MKILRRFGNTSKLSVPPMSREREARQGIGGSKISRNACAALLCASLAACGGGSGGSGSGNIQATKIANINGPGGCGVRDAHRVTAVSGIRLSTPATINMTTARALDHWVTNTVKPTIGRKGGGLVELKVAAHYACRTRNNRRGARLSEHAKGNAIDISAFRLADGSQITVLNGWRSADGGLLRKLHRGACGPFGTVLGPDADRHHQDHFHFDVANNGPYCR